MFEPKHTALLEQYADKYGVPTINDVQAREWTQRLAEQFAYTFPNEGWGTKKAGPVNPPSTDVICRPEPPTVLVGYDVVIASGSPEARLNSHPDPIDISNQVFIPVTPTNHLGTGAYKTLLGKSLFWAWAGYKHWSDQLEEDLNAITQDLEADYVRWFFTVGGDRKPTDPWLNAGAWFDDPQHLSIARGVMRLLKLYGLKSHLTLCGGLNEDGTVGDMYKTEEQRFAIVDRAAELINEFPEDFIMVEMWNEYDVNGSNTAWMRAMARRLQSRIPHVIPITLSSPNSVMGGHQSDEEVKAEIAHMYDGLPEATGRTMHSTRPTYYWNTKTIRRVDFNRWLDGEPMGPGASAGGDITDPVVLGDMFQIAKEGNAVGMTLHSEVGVWGHHLNHYGYYHPEWKKMRDITNWKQICETLKAVRAGEPVPEPEPDMIPYDENLSIDFGTACNDVYTESGAPKDPGMVSVHSSRAAWDYYVGKLPWEESKKKHINEFRAEYGLPPLVLIFMLLFSSVAQAQTTNPCTEPIGFQMLPDGQGQVFVPLLEHTVMEPDGKTPRVGEYSYALFNEGTNPDAGTPVQGPTTVPKTAFTLIAGTTDCYNADLPATIPMDIRLVAALKALGPNGTSGWSPISNPFSSVPNVPKAPGKPVIRP